MLDKHADIFQQEENVEQSAWVRPEVVRIAAGEAETSGATGDDGVIGNS